MEALLEGGFTIARDLQADKMGALKHLLRMAVLMDEVKDDFYMTQAPMQALLRLFAALAPIGRMVDSTGERNGGCQCISRGTVGEGLAGSSV
jgi:hypothetical protein